MRIKALRNYQEKVDKRLEKKRSVKTKKRIRVLKRKIDLIKEIVSIRKKENKKKVVEIED